MSVRISLTDDELPPSGAFLRFLDKWLAGEEFDGTNWAVYGEERAGTPGGDLSPAAPECVQRVMRSDEGIRLLARAYELFVALLIGDMETLRAHQDRFDYVLVIGLPRSGGKYMTKELFRALGHDPVKVPSVLAYDGFPETRPWHFDSSGNSWIESLQSMAEYLTMVELSFGARGPRPAAVTVVKKAMKAAYAPGLYRGVLGRSGRGVVTVRHPVPQCISTYETAGGLPDSGRFEARSNIERFCARDLITGGLRRDDLPALEYFDAYLRYWEGYHLRLAREGVHLVRDFDVVPYGADHIMDAARRVGEAVGSSRCEVERFEVIDRRDRHPAWMGRAELVVSRVHEEWSRAGLRFPLEAVLECW